MNIFSVCCPLQLPSKKKASRVKTELTSECLMPWKWVGFTVCESTHIRLNPHAPVTGIIPTAALSPLLSQVSEEEEEKVWFQDPDMLSMPEWPHPRVVLPSGSGNWEWNPVLTENKQQRKCDILLLVLGKTDTHTPGGPIWQWAPTPGKTKSLSVLQSPSQFAMQILSPRCCLTASSLRFCCVLPPGTLHLLQGTRGLPQSFPSHKLP